MRAVVVVVVGALALACALLSVVASARLVSRPTLSSAPHVRASPEECKLCIDFAVGAINDLLNIILNSGVIAGCSDLCSKLPNPLEAKVCDALCTVVGLDEFIKALERSDLDPIYYCELIDMCKIVDCQGDCLDITALQMVPPTAKVGDKIVAHCDFDVKQQTGTGMTRIDIFVPKGMPMQDDLLEVGFPPGNYSMNMEIDTEGQGLEPGTYTFSISFCEGECGSHHPHSKVYDVRNATFTLTK